MKRVIALLALTVQAFLVSPAIAQKSISSEEAAKFVGHHGTVCGMVASAHYALHSKGRPTFLDLDKPRPNQIFTVLVWGVDRNRFKKPPESFFAGKMVCVTGTITNYHGKPLIVVKSPSQMTLPPEKKNSATKHPPAPLPDHNPMWHPSPAVLMSHTEQGISPEEAAKFVGEHRTVCGVVASAHYALRNKGHPTFLDLGKPRPNQIFTVLIRADDRHKFKEPPETLYSGKIVCVTGTITSYHGKPQIVVTSPSEMILANEQMVSANTGSFQHCCEARHHSLHHYKHHKGKRAKVSLHPSGLSASRQPAPSPKSEAPRQPSSIDSFAAVEQTIKGLEFGNIAFNAPHEIDFQDTAIIRLVLGLRTPIDKLKQLIEHAVGEKESARIQISNRMEARLSGSTFAITAITPEKQAVTQNSITEWEWEVKPTASGMQDLHLTLSVIINVDGTPIEKTIRTFDRHIQVKVPKGRQVVSFIENNWQWLWAAILVPIFGLVWRKKKGRAQRKRSPAMSRGRKS